MCQANDIETGDGSAPSASQSDLGEEAERVAKALVDIDFGGGDLHDKAHDMWSALREVDLTADHSAQHYDCALCGATMFPSLDYTHLPTCPYEVISQQIDIFADAVLVAYSKIAERQTKERKAR